MENKKMEPANLDEAPKDPGALTTHHSYTDKDFEGHRAHTVYVGLHVPSYRRRGHHRRHRHHARNGHGGHKRREDGMSTDYVTDLHRPVTPPAERVHFILGEEEDGMHESHPLFSEMEELHVDGDEMEWRETARWIKFEEDVEEGGNRWSKPHVATISLHSLFELRSCILNGTVMLDMEAGSLDQIADLVLENMINAGHLQADLRERIKEALLRRHRHQHEPRHDKGEKGSRLPLIRSLADIGRNSSKSMFSSHSNSTSALERQSSGIWYVSSPSSSSPVSLKDWKPDFVKLPIIHEPDHSSPSNMHPEGGNVNGATNGGMPNSPSSNSLQGNQGNHNLLSIGGGHGDVPSNPSSADLHKTNHPFMKKIPPGAEASNILVGEVEFLDRAVIAFVRLGQACHLGDLTEVPVPTRFLFVLLGPTGNLGRYHEIGRAMATLMSDEVFHDVAYKAKSRQDLLAGVDEFLDAVTVLPPGAWDPSIRIEPPNQIPSQESRKKADQEIKHTIEEIEDEEDKEREESGLKRTGRIFGGLVNDVKRKKPFYLSDFKDALALQTVASIFFLYFACIAPIITFGGLLEDATGQNIAAMESLLSGAICGVIYGLFSGQPLTILGSTGPVLVFETILFDFCRDNGFDYLPLRLWIGMWTSGILMVLVATDASALVCYITRFTEENFATLISLIFIYKAIEKVLNINTKYPLLTDASSPINLACVCLPPNGTESIEPSELYNWTAISKYECAAVNGTMTGVGCDHVPNVFLFSVILFLGTFSLSVFLKDFKTSSFFPTNIRQVVSDFAVVIAIMTMTLIDVICAISTPKLQVPAEFKPTSPHRGWLVPWFKNNPWWTALAACLPALLCTILIFMDQQITAVIINRKENKLKKGCGYHLDLFVLSILIAICSILGLPWFVAATVLAMTHVNSLKMESESAAPGEKPQFLGVREQRVSQVIIFTMIGMSVFFTPVLRCIPMPVLYGVFLYMGVSSLKGSQFFDRILIMFMPQKYQPDYMFLRQVPILRCHIFTVIQMTCLVMLWVIKSYKPTSISFPLMLVVMIGVRKCLDFFFTQRELKILDDVMPESTRRKRAEDQMKLEEEENNKDNPNEPQKKKKKKSKGGMVPNASSGNVAIPLANGNILKVPVDRFKDEDQSNINITEQLSKTPLWQSIDQQVQITPKSQAKTSISVPIPASKKKKRGSKKDAMNDEERKRLSTMAEDEEDDDDCGITIQIDGPTPAPSNGPSTQNSPKDPRRRSTSSIGSHNETSV